MKFPTTLRFSIMAASLLFVGTADAQVYATSSSNYNPGPLADGVSPIASVRPARTNPNNVVGFVDPSTNDSNIGEGSGTVQFVSLGYGGSIELQFATPICNIVGPDFKVWETSYGNSSNCVAWPERAAVYARQDACQPWVLLTPYAGQCLDFEVDLGFLSWASEIRIEDRTDETTPVFQSSNQDAFDVDGIEGYVGCAIPAVTPANKYSPSSVDFISQGLQNNGTPVPASRSIQSKMLGAPQASDVTTSAANNNFLSLGYNGTTTLKFPYTIFNVSGADLQVFETTFGDNASRPCSSYPEKARFQGSIDGSTFFDLDAEVTADDAGAILCRDGKLNIPAAYGGINFIKITDLTVIGTVPGLSDGYDVDGIVGLNQCASTTNAGRNTESFTEVIGEGEFGVSVYPNPADKFVSIEINATNSTDNYTVTVIDVMGRVVANEVILNNASSSMIQNMDISVLPSGLYLVTVKNNDSIEVSRFVKK
jgi:hypothetical protein